MIPYRVRFTMQGFSLWKRGQFMKNFSLLAILLVITILLINDYFSNVIFPFQVSNLQLILLLLVLFVVNHFMADNDSNKQKLKSELFLLIYIAGLIVLLTLLGGESNTFLAVDNFILTILFVFDLLRIRFQWKKETKENEVRRS